jgi:hypothetical protein
MVRTATRMGVLLDDGGRHFIKVRSSDGGQNHTRFVSQSARELRVVIDFQTRSGAFALPPARSAAGLVDLAGGWVERSIGQPSAASPTISRGCMVLDASRPAPLDNPSIAIAPAGAAEVVRERPGRFVCAQA